jgi:hypothetical protein
LIIIDRAHNQLDSLMFVDELYGMRAENPQDLGTIIWLDCREVNIGHYVLDPGGTIMGGMSIVV